VHLIQKTHEIRPNYLKTLDLCLPHKSVITIGTGLEKGLHQDVKTSRLAHRTITHIQSQALAVLVRTRTQNQDTTRDVATEQCATRQEASWSVQEQQGQHEAQDRGTNIVGHPLRTIKTRRVLKIVNNPSLSSGLTISKMIS